jgi:hypothetical protein
MLEKIKNNNITISVYCALILVLMMKIGKENFFYLSLLFILIIPVYITINYLEHNFKYSKMIINAIVIISIFLCMYI